MWLRQPLNGTHRESIRQGVPNECGGMQGLLIKTWHKAKFCSKWSQMTSVYGESMFHRQQRGLMIQGGERVRGGGRTILLIQLPETLESSFLQFIPLVNKLFINDLQVQFKGFDLKQKMLLAKWNVFSPTKVIFSCFIWFNRMLLCFVSLVVVTQVLS